MSIDQAVMLGKHMFETALIVGAPVLIATFLIGIIISILQAATQIHEMTLTFIPKIIAALLSILIFGSWMTIKLVNYAKLQFSLIASLIR